MKSCRSTLVAALTVAVCLWSSPVWCTDYFIYNTYGGTWQDAKKDWNGDANLCWAASASNILEWGNWDVSQFSTENQIFDEFEANWTDYGSKVDRGLRWWLNGTLPSDPTSGTIIWSSVDVPGGGNYWSSANFNSHYRYSDSGNLMAFLDTNLADGFASSFGIYRDDRATGHAITVWGFNYDQYRWGKDYRGVYVTDSDAFSTGLQYYPITWNSSKSRYELGGGYDGWHLEYVAGLDRNPSPASAKFSFTYYYGGGIDWYEGFVVAPMSYYDLQDYENHRMDEHGKTGDYIITAVAPNDKGYYNGWVQVTKYHDLESNLDFNIINAYGGDYLGSEYGFLYDKSTVPGFRFGSYLLDPIEHTYANNEADVSLIYNFLFSYPSGDKYSGQGYMSPNYYYEGDKFNKLAEGGMGTYSIGKIVKNVGYDPGLAGTVKVTTYYDAKNGFNLAVSGLGSNYLGSESGYLFDYERDCYKFGLGLAGYINNIPIYLIMEADRPFYYMFSYTYPNGDKYSGYGYEHPDSEYVTGYSKTMAAESGGFGTYNVTLASAANVGVAPVDCGSVYVTKYYDSESGATLTVSGTGTNRLGSEIGYLYGLQESSYKFGYGLLYTLLGRSVYGILEADTPELYNFSYTYPNGDTYSGYGYAHPDSIYDTSFSKTLSAEGGGSGTYAIASTKAVDIDPSNVGLVYVTQYYDSESGATLSVSGSGSNYLGSEKGYIFPGTTRSDYKFGYDVFAYINKIPLYLVFEADTPKIYYFSYTYPNGDKYWGHGYAHPDSEYDTGYSKTLPAEGGGSGTYAISSANAVNIDFSKAGSVYVTQYDDAESGAKRAVSGSGNNYLGSEKGYLYPGTTLGDYKFGYDIFAYINKIPLYLVFEADAPKIYNFRFDYKGGDYYEGFGYAPPSHEYATGYIKEVTAEDGEGSYKILSVAYKDVNPSSCGQVFVNIYHDGESNKNFTPLQKGQAVGTAFLGSELDYICRNRIAAYKFGQGYYEADVGDKYAFKYSYGNGDYYQGYVYRTPGYVYYPGYKFTKKNELGLTGTYEILSMSYTGDTANYGKVFVNTYYDGESKKSFNPVHKGQAVGAAFLGSESDYIGADGAAVYKFGQGYIEADVGDQYTFRYTYGNGDYYEGTVYRTPGYVYYPGYRLAKKNETGKTGYYEILSMSYTGDTAKYRSGYGEVYVTSYYNAENKKTYSPLKKGQAVGTAFLSSEQDYIIKAGVAVYKFGQGYSEADVGDKYKFRYSYGNGDYYEGYVYRTPGYVYYPGYKLSKKNELNLNGYYQILSMSYSGETAKYGKVYVNTYHDGDRTTAKNFTPVNAASPLGSAFLGSEAGYIPAAGIARHYFGKGYYEADE